jgi:hypothetical protein
MFSDEARAFGRRGGRPSRVELKSRKVPWLAQRRGGAELIRVAGTETDDAEVVPPAWEMRAARRCLCNGIEADGAET